MNRKIEIIDVLRGLAALVVVFLHAREIAWVGIRASWQANGLTLNPSVILGYVTAPVVWGSIGVPIFFVLSGYCIHRSHALRLQADPQYDIDRRDYLRRRFFRIYPILLAALVLTYLLDAATRHYAPDHPKLGLDDPFTFLVNLSALQGILAPTFGSNGPLWTLSIEIQLYVFYLLLFPFRKRYGIPATALVALVITFVSANLSKTGPTDYFAPYLISWCIGAYLAEPGALAKWTVHFRNRLKLSSVVLIGLGCAVFSRSSYTAFILWSLGFGLCLPVLLSKEWKDTVLLKALSGIGNFSYSLYIVHVPVIVFLSAYFFAGNKPESVIFSIFCVLASIVASYLFYLAVERPAIVFLKRRSTRALA